MSVSAAVLRAKMASGPVFGSFVKIPRVEHIEMLTLAGFDFLVCDNEHGQFGESEILALLAFARAKGTPVVVRLAGPDRGVVNRILEAGAAGIQLARTRRAEAAQLADVMRYPPLGSRSVSLVQPAAVYGQRNMRDYLDTCNAAVLAVGQIETADYANDLAETVAALDVAFIGPVDLSVDLGFDGALDAPEVVAAIEFVAKTCAQVGTPWGIYAADIPSARRAIDDGARYVVISSDAAMLLRGANAVSPATLRR